MTQGINTDWICVLIDMSVTVLRKLVCFLYGKHTMNYWCFSEYIRKSQPAFEFVAQKGSFLRTHFLTSLELKLIIMWYGKMRKYNKNSYLSHVLSSYEMINQQQFISWYKSHFSTVMCCMTAWIQFSLKVLWLISMLNQV